MKKGIFIFILLILALFSVSCIYAADVNDTLTASEDNLEIDQTTDDVIGVGEDTNLASSEENEVLSEGEQTFTQLNTTINGNTDNDIYLNGNYKYSNGDDSFKDGIVIDRDVNIYGNGATIDGNSEARIFQINGGNVVFYNIIFVNGNAGNEWGDYGGAINGNCKAINCTFKENHAHDGGAMADGSAVNCTFTGNTAKWDGGAMFDGSAVNCTFNGNSAISGGAMEFGSAVNCTFNGNSASSGGAMEFGSAVNCTFNGNSASSGGAMKSGSAVNCTFNGNSASSGGAMEFGSAIDCTFTGNTADFGGAMFNSYYLACIGQEGDYYGCDSLVLYFDVSDFTSTYKSDKMFQIILTGEQYGRIDFINVDVVIYKDGVGEVMRYSCLSGDSLIFDLAAGTYTANLIITYPKLGHISTNIRLTIKKATTKITAAGITATYNINKDLVITLKDIRGNPLANQILLVDFNGAKTFDFTDLNGTIKVPVKGLEAKNYSAEIVFMGDDNYNRSKATAEVTVNRDSTSLSGDEVTAVYNVNKNLVITLKDSLGNPIKGAAVDVDLNGVKTLTTDAKGQVKISTGSLVPKTYAAKITFNGNDNYLKSSKDVKVTVTKATPKLTAKAKTFKKSVKTKKYSITLKDNRNKAISKATVTIKIKGKTYKAKTNAKGKAVFKIKKLTKKGKYKATIKFAGNNCYNKVTKKVKITIK